MNDTLSSNATNTIDAMNKTAQQAQSGMVAVPVDLGEQRYDVYIGADILSQSNLLASHVDNRDILIVADSNVAPLYAETLTKMLQATNCRHIGLFTLEAGEAQKNLTTIEAIYTSALEKRYDRQCCFIALGGGVVGDMAGFAAATYLRGVPFIQIPTTLLSQVDSSVGGKTGVNHPLGKNMIGAFYQPKSVIIDTNTLGTLPAREISAGLAEIIKYGFIHDVEFFNWVIANTAALKSIQPDEIRYAIQRSCEIKAEIVKADEKERGVRAHLNLGHTFGHAIENLLGYGEWLHGEAVAVGMRAALLLSASLKQIDLSVIDQYDQWLDDMQLPKFVPDSLQTSDILAAMGNDKKIEFGQWRLVLLRQLGEAEIRADLSQTQIAEAIDRCRA